MGQLHSSKQDHLKHILLICFVLLKKVLFCQTSFFSHSFILENVKILQIVILKTSEIEDIVTAFCFGSASKV